jgi:hypothetical protein
LRRVPGLINHEVYDRYVSNDEDARTFSAKAD